MVGAGTYVISKKLLNVSFRVLFHLLGDASRSWSCSCQMVLLIAAWKFLGFGACSVPMPGGPIWLSRAAALRAVLPE